MAKLIKVEDVAEILNISLSMSYKVMAEVNRELKQKGFMTIRGRVPEEYIRKRYNLLDEEVVSKND
ncbi:transcriptional regulator [Anaerosphaera multitolerans]|uniref:Transcriptional regulator n=1 Tax=Anaerosphaera multitolerans TaxID=2487351 RepID=A0A437S6M9_9FIRM|nr:transcriptional regulator [Anaerosphaera multitolerans]RVU54651.1 transcriptional regulator [Anaerosphaera multitolerans]